MNIFFQLPWFVWFLLLPALLAIPVLIRASAVRGTRLDLPQAVVLGEHLSASIFVPAELRDPVPVIVRCFFSEDKNPGDSDSTRDTTVEWQTETLATPCFDGRATTLSFRVHLPADQPASTAPGENPSNTWEIRAKIKRFGIFHTLTYKINVLPHALPREQISRVLPQPDDFSSLAPLLRDKGITLARGKPGAFEFVFGFSPGTSIFCFLFAAGFFTGVYFTLARWEIFASVILSVFGGTLFYAGIYLLTTHGIRCDTTARVFTFWWRFVFCPPKETPLPFDRVRRFSIHGFNLSFVQCHTAEGKTHKVGAQLPDKHSAKVLSNFLNAQLNMLGY